MNAAIILILLLGLMCIRVPIAFSLLIAGGTYLVFLSEIPIVVIAQRLGGAVESFPLLAVPLFILAAEFMNRGMATTRIFDFASHCVGHVKGSLGHVNVLASMIFAGMSGSDVADTAGLGRIEIRAMSEKGFDLKFSAAITGASSIVGGIIPPSVVLIIYGSIGEQSVGRLFLGGAIPGLIMGLALMALVYVISARRGYPVDPFPGFRKLFASFWKALPTLFIPVTIMGGIIGGIFTPTEAGAVAVVYTFILSVFVYRDIKLREVIDICYDASISSAMILFILGAASVFSWAITLEQIPQMFQGVILDITDNKWVVLLILNLLLVVLGLFFGAITVILIVTPMIVPLAAAYGIDLVHMGIVMVLNLSLGYLTPPFGLGLFILSDITKMPVEKLARAMVPFYLPILAVLILVTYIPALSVYLPNLLMGPAL